MKVRTCKNCKKEFTPKTSYNARYPQRYCEKCSKERKKAYENIHNVKFSDCEDD